MYTVTAVPPRVIWRMDAALALVRSLEIPCKDAGYYVALAGGVLLRGQSTNDLDVLVVPRTNMECDPVKLHTYLYHRFVFKSEKVLAARTILHMSINKKPVDITVFK